MNDQNKDGSNIDFEAIENKAAEECLEVQHIRKDKRDEIRPHLLAALQAARPEVIKAARLYNERGIEGKMYHICCEAMREVEKRFLA